MRKYRTQTEKNNLVFYFKTMPRVMLLNVSSFICSQKLN